MTSWATQIFKRDFAMSVVWYSIRDLVSTRGPQKVHILAVNSGLHVEWPAAAKCIAEASNHIKEVFSSGHCFIIRRGLFIHQVTNVRVINNSWIIFWSWYLLLTPRPRRNAVSAQMSRPRSKNFRQCNWIVYFHQRDILWTERDHWLCCCNMTTGMTQIRPETVKHGFRNIELEIWTSYLW